MAAEEKENRFRGEGSVKHELQGQMMCQVHELLESKWWLKWFQRKDKTLSLIDW